MLMDDGTERRETYYTCRKNPTLWWVFCFEGKASNLCSCVAK